MSKPPSKHQKSTSGVSADLDLPANSVNQDKLFHIDRMGAMLQS